MTTLRPITHEAPPLAGRAIASQRWSDLTFLHWRVSSTEVAPLLPAGVVPDEFDGSSWVGLIPFRLDRATLFGSPPVPGVTDRRPDSVLFSPGVTTRFGAPVGDDF